MFDKPTVQKYRELMNALLTPLGEKLGVAISVGKAKYTVNNIVFNVEVAKLTPTRKILT
jgi:hypothetical protein